MTCRISMIFIAVLAFAGWAAVAADVTPPVNTHAAARQLATGPQTTASASKPVLGPIAAVTEQESGIGFVARVDTGAKVCSIHADDISVIDGSDAMQENTGKVIRFRITNRNGESTWLERQIAEVSLVKNANGAEWRYLVPMTLACEGSHKQVLVSLNDRSEMNYAMLLGRNLLAGAFLVDVSAIE